MSVVGHNEVIDHILNNEKFSHAYLFETDASTDVESVVLTFASNILTKGLTQEEKEKINNLIHTQTYSDLKIVRPEVTMIKKEQLIDLQKEFTNKSMYNNKRIYIIFEADKLNLSSANSILKFLEEPNDDIIAILVTQNRYKLLPTIVSRCQIIHLSNVNFEQNILDNTLEFVKIILERKNLFLSQSLLLSNIMADKNQAKDVLLELEEYFFTLYLKKENVKSSVLKNEIEIDLDMVKSNDLLKYILIIEENLKKIEYNINYKLWLDCFLIELLEV